MGLDVGRWARMGMDGTKSYFESLSYCIKYFIKYFTKQ